MAAPNLNWPGARHTSPPNVSAAVLPRASSNKFSETLHLFNYTAVFEVRARNISQQRREGEGAVRLFSTDKESVMAYEFPPLIQESDKRDIKAFYKLPQLKDFTPDN